MASLKFVFLFFVYVLFYNVAFPNNLNGVDSLLKVIDNTKEDTVKLKTYLLICNECKIDDNFKFANLTRQLADKLNSKTKDPVLKKRIVEQKAELYLCLTVYFGSYQDSSRYIFDFCQSLISDYQELGDTVGILNTNLKLSYNYAKILDFKKAFDYCQEALLLAQKINNKHGIAKSLVAKALLYKDQGDFQQSMVNLEKALINYKDVGDTEKVVYVLKLKGSVYSNLKNIDEAISAFQEAISLNIAMNSKEGLRDAYNQLGLIYSKNNDLDNALKNYKIALSYAEKLPDQTWMRGILGNIGDVFREKGDVSKAIEYHTLAINSVKPLNNQVQESWVNWQFTQDYIKLQDFKKAKLYNDRFLQVMRRNNNTEEISSGEKAAAQIDSALGNYKDAFTHFQQHIYFRDKLYSDEIKKQAIKEKFQTEFQEQKKRDELLQSQKDALSRQQLQKQKIIRNSFITGSILLILLIFVLINRNKLKRSVEMEKMRSRLSRDLHDDIGSTLSSINILSRMATSNLKHSDDEKTKASLEKINERSQRLLDNMSDIIWNINPGNDTIEEVMSRMREYATTILEAKNIDYAFNFPKEKLDCTLNMDVKNNMYLIFKEAINNLSKYSEASMVNLSLTFDEKNICMKIEDNGVGFKEDEIKHNGGLNNMYHRAEEIKGIIRINSQIGIGTLIELTMPRFC